MARADPQRAGVFLDKIRPLDSSSKPPSTIHRTSLSAGTAKDGGVHSFAPQPRLAELVTLDVEPGAFWFGAWRNLNLLVWHRGPDKAAVARLDATNPARTKAHPEGISTVHIIRETAKQPDAETRDAFNAMHAQWGHTVGCAVIVIEQRGFLGVAVRSAVAGMSMVAPKFYRIRVVDSVEVAAPWLAENHTRSTDVQISPAEALTILSQARLRGQ